MKKLNLQSRIASIFLLLAILAPLAISWTTLSAFALPSTAPTTSPNPTVTPIPTVKPPVTAPVTPTPKCTSSSIMGYVFWDTNQNGIREASETTHPLEVSGWRVNTPQGKLITSYKGWYTTTAKIPLAKYTVSVDLKKGYRFTTVSSKTFNLTCSNARADFGVQFAK